MRELRTDEIELAFWIPVAMHALLNSILVALYLAATVLMSTT